jgi:predicted RNA methylase
MGSIDLDPFSCAEANKSVRARRFFSKEESAIGRPWCAHGKVTVFMNPPYGRETLRPAIRAFLDAWLDGQISQAIVLVNNATETQWFQSLADECAAMCLVAKRIAFYNTDGKECSGNTRGQIFLYFGHDKKRFKIEFSLIGVVL